MLPVQSKFSQHLRGTNQSSPSERKKSVLPQVAGLALLGLLAGCGPSAQEKAEFVEKKRIECLDRHCRGDEVPSHDPKDVAFKINGRWYIGPRVYFGHHNSAVIYWPSKWPAGYEEGRAFPHKGQPFYEVAIELLFRSSHIPPEPRGYELIELAEKQGWIAKRESIRPGLDALTMKHVIGPRGYYIDHVTYYVATQLTGPDGLPPVAGCSHDIASNSAGSGFIWRPGFWVGVRMHKKHCADWPEIYTEIDRVLQQLTVVQ